jgi:TolA-binding protein
MKNQFLTLSLFAFLILFSACGNKEKIEAQEDLIGLEQDYNEDKIGADALIKKLNEYTVRFPDDIATNARYMFRAGEIYFEQNDLNNAEITLKKGIDNYKQEDATPKSLKLLGDIYTKTNKLTEAITVFSKLTREHATHPTAKEAATAIPSEIALTQRMANLEKMMLDSSQSTIRGGIARELARTYQQYAIVKPDAEDATEKLMKASQNYGAVGDFINATTISKSIIELNPKTEFAKDAMFHIAYLYGEMARYDKAKKEEYDNNSKKYYEMLIKGFPNDPLAKQSKLLIKNIGKTDDELLQDILNKNKK